MPKVSFDIDGKVQSKWRVVKISSATLVLANANLELYRAIGERIAHTRKARCLSRPELGQLIGVSQTTIENIETCRFSVRVSVAMLHVIAVALNVAIIELLPTTDEIEFARIDAENEPVEELALNGHHKFFYQQQIGRRIYEERIARNVKVEELAKQIPYSVLSTEKNGMAIPRTKLGIINKVETGKVPADIFMLLAITNALGCAIEDLLPPIQIDALSGIVDILFRTERHGALSPNALLLRDLFRQGYGEKMLQVINERLESLETDEPVAVRSDYLIGLLEGCSG